MLIDSRGNGYGGAENPATLNFHGRNHPCHAHIHPRLASTQTTPPCGPAEDLHDHHSSTSSTRQTSNLTTSTEILTPLLSPSSSFSPTVPTPISTLRTPPKRQCPPPQAPAYRRTPRGAAALSPPAPSTPANSSPPSPTRCSPSPTAPACAQPATTASA